MNDSSAFFQNIYAHFNQRNIEEVISNMTEDVQWANGMEGGYVHGHTGVREYWTRQFKLVSSKVTPLEIKNNIGISEIRVHQVVHDLEGNLLSDEMVTHFFQLKEEKIIKFDIGGQ